MAKVSIPSNVEPTYGSDEVSSKLNLIESLNWYQTHKNEKDAAKYLNCESKIAKNHLTYAWLVRMVSRGIKLSDSATESMNNLKEKFEKDLTPKDTSAEVDENGNVIVAEKPTVNIQERINQKTDEHIGELEGMVDDYGHAEKADKFNAYDWFVKNEVKPIHAAKIADYFKTRAKLLIEALEDPDKEYAAAHQALGKNKIKNILAVMTNIVKDSERLAQNVNKTRKPRKKKAVSFEKLVSKLRFKEKDDNFKIQSINPISIIGADQVWVFNVKTRKLGVYIALDGAGLMVKGSSIVNYSNSSVSKTLRKPEKILTTVLDGGKIALRKVMDSINSKAVPMNGRINKDTIILRASK